MRSLGCLFLLSILWMGCAPSPLGTSDSESPQDQKWLVRLATLRVRDETILKTQDKIPLNFVDLCELLNKEVDNDDLLSLVGELGVSPKLKRDEIHQLEQLGATPELLRKLGQTTPLQVSRTVTVQKEKVENTKPIVPPPSDSDSPLPSKSTETETKSEATPPPKKRTPATLSSDHKNVILHTLDPNSKR